MNAGQASGPTPWFFPSAARVDDPAPHLLGAELAVNQGLHVRQELRAGLMALDVRACLSRSELYYAVRCAAAGHSRVLEAALRSRLKRH